MPPLSQPQVVGWLLLFIPGFVALSVMSWIGWPATRRSQLHWVAYSVIGSLVCEVIVRLSIDRVWAPWVDPVQHPIRRAGALLLVGCVLGLGIGLLQYSWRTNQVMWRLLGESAMPTVWLAYFRNPATWQWLRLETTLGKVVVAHVDSYSTDPGDPNQELVLTDAELQTDHGWEVFPGPLYVNARQIAVAVCANERSRLKTLGSLIRPTDGIGSLTKG